MNPRARYLAGLLPLVLLSGCPPTTESYPVETIHLCGSGCVSKKHPHDEVTRFAGGKHTVTWGGEAQLGATVHDPQGSGQRLEWDPAYQGQELIAFDLIYSDAEPPATCEPQICYAPIKDVRFASLQGHGDANPHPVQRSLDRTTGQIVRYDHGKCRLGISWTKFFNDTSDGLLAAFKCAERCTPNGVSLNSETRKFDEFAPHFTGQLDDIRHGFEFDAKFDLFANAGPLPAFIEVQMNPAYRFDVRSDTGLLRVIPIQQRVVVVNDSPGNDIKKETQGSLETTLPERVESLVGAAMTFALPPPSVSCSAGASLGKQQQACYDAVTRSGPGGSDSPALIAFRQAFQGQGWSADKVEKKARQAVEGLEPRNFVCAPEGTCSFHPIIQRVNALPEQVEFVLADRFDDPKVALYQGLTRILQAFPSPPPGLPADLCDGSFTRPSEGQVAFVRHGEKVAVIPPGVPCGPCPP